jgi:hypothetical protein
MISMLNAFTAITFRFSVDDNNTTSLVRVYGYLTIEPNQTYFKDYSDAMAGRFHILMYEINFFLFLFE